MDVRDNFLFIDTENCDRVTRKLYGWCILPSAIAGEAELLKRPNLLQETYDGSYVAVQDFSDTVTICQDAIGSRGLYLYQAKGYFALSDSFLLLMEKLSKFHRCLTLNRDYLDSFLLNGYTMEACVSTPVLEIQELPRNVSVKIDKIKKTVSFYEKELKERSVDISSSEAMHLMDAWYEKWTGIFRGLIRKEADLNVDLSGGFDSRLVFMLAAGAKPDWNKMNINSYRSTVHTFKEDYEIAEKIAMHYGTQLNACEKNWAKMPIAGHDSLAWSFYIRLGFHKQLQFQLYRYKRPMFHFAGVGGETIRHYHAATKAQYIYYYRERQKGHHLGYDFMHGFVTTLERSEKIIQRMHRNHLLGEFGTLLWNEGGDRHHHGKEMAEAYGSNEMRIGPLLDNALQSIQYGEKYPYLLNAVLLTRFAPNLLEFGFDGHREIPERTLREARRINALFPKKTARMNSDEYRFVFHEPFLAIGTKAEFRDSLWEWCKKIYESGFVKGNMGKLYPARVYEHAKAYYASHDIYPMEEMWAAIAVAYAVHCTEQSKTSENGDFCTFMEEKQETYMSDVEDFMPQWPVPEHRLYPDCRIILYGAGKMGCAFRKQIERRGLGKIIIWVDKEPTGKGEEVRPVQALEQVPEHDVLLVAIANRKIQKEAVDALRGMKIPGFSEDKIVLG